jgi:TRAP transporter 4TM/12TM fusion protein
MADTVTTDTRAALETMVAEADTGGRKPTGLTKNFIFMTALCWAMFQLWYASPLPYKLGVGVFPDGHARIIHLTFAFILAFLTFPAFKKSSPRGYVPIIDWLLAAVSAGVALYLLVFYNQIALRPGLPSTTDIVVSVLGLILLLEAARRAVGSALAIIGVIMISYIFAGPWLPGLLAHKGASLGRVASQMWLTSEGVFGVALGVSTNVVFFFVLFGSLLEKAGAGNFFIQLAFSLLGTFRGGPAKAGVVASGMTGMISGSSIANTVTTGTFTIPLMKRVGYSAVKAGAIECAAGVNGQLMPPVMGAAAFLMAEYVGISYAEVVKHAFVPAFLTYGALFYVVDLEAAKAGMRGLHRTKKTAFTQTLLRALMTISGMFALCGVMYYGVAWTKVLFGEAASYILGAALVAAYLGLMRYKAAYPDLEDDDLSKAIVKVPDFYETARTGLHFMLPVVVLIWCLMVEELSPGLSAFWSTVFLIVIVLTQRPLMAYFRGRGNYDAAIRKGWQELLDSFAGAARNMTSVGIATAGAGIIVGTVALTGIGLIMSEIVETVSGGNIALMLWMTAFVCLLLGIGMPTTANYVVVATLMAPVLVEVAAQNDLAIPLIAVHMFVFYYGLMADVHPPVGLAAYAAAAISKADPIMTGLQGFWYEIRTGLLPFIFIYNTGLLLIDIESWLQLFFIISCAIVAMGCFVSATQFYMLTRNRWYESIALLVICLTLFRPSFWLDYFYDPYIQLPASEITRIAADTSQGSTVRFKVASETRAGDPIDKVLRLSIAAGATGEEKLRSVGLMSLRPMGDTLQITAVKFGSEAAKFGLTSGNEIKTVYLPNQRPNPYWMTLPGFAVLGLIIMMQLRRRRKAGPAIQQAAAPAA